MTSINVITLDDSKYPSLLKKIKNPPKKIYYKGIWNTDIFNNCLAVVGSRGMTFYGKKSVAKILSELNKNLCIVSGFMYGVDAEAHFQAIQNNLKTIAVMPCGLDFITPNYQDKLLNNIIAHGGLILSEFEHNIKPKVWTYSKRNRIVAGLSKAVLIVETAKHSGSMITANYGKMFNRKVFAVPGSIFSDLSSGTHELLKSYGFCVDAGDVINQYYGLNNISIGICQKNSHYSAEATKILHCLQSYPMSIDSLCTVTGIQISILSQTITLLLLNGQIIEEGGRFYAR